MVKDVKAVRRNNKQVVGGHLFQHTTLGATYESRNMGTLHNPHWVIEDDTGKAIGVNSRANRALFQPIYQESTSPVVNPDLRAKYDQCGIDLPSSGMSLPIQ